MKLFRKTEELRSEGRSLSVSEPMRPFTTNLQNKVGAISPNMHNNSAYARVCARFCTSKKFDCLRSQWFHDEEPSAVFLLI